jgi:hypothetical protein
VDPLEQLLGQLSWKYVRSDPEWTPYMLPDDGDVAKWKDDIAAWAGRIWCHANEMPEGPELRAFDLMSLKEQFREYIGREGPGLYKRGMSLEEIWCSTQLYNAAPHVLLLNERFAQAATERIAIKRLLKADVLVWLIGMMCSQFEVRTPAIRVLVTNGRSGHTIVIAGMNGVAFEHPRGGRVKPGWFSLHDPWPARSLLSPAHGYPIEVLEDITRPPLWLVSPADLSEIVVALMVDIDLLSHLLGFFKALDVMTPMFRDAGTPLWTENPFDRNVLFSLTLALKSGVTPTTVAGYVGLGRYQLMAGDLSSAMSSFDAAIRVDPAVAPAAAAVLKDAGYGDLAEQLVAGMNS